MVRRPNTRALCWLYVFLEEAKALRSRPDGYGCPESSLVVVATVRVRERE